MKDAIVAILIILIFCIFGAFTIFTSYLEERQPIIVYQSAYSSNLECRKSADNSHSNQYINDLCGPIPQIGDYQ